jgi:pimeloyl-ACP methyl ester carboxylesterase
MTSFGSRVTRTPRCAAALASLAMLASTGCATPAQRVDREASSLGYTRSLLQGRSFRHVVYANGRDATGRTLHVYLDGDGSPYVDRWTVSPDPTPRHPLMLQLMALDPDAAVYVGRPCYLGLASEPPCTAIDWTLGRFAPGVVDSLEGVIRRLRETSGATHVDLFGHSGGGTLAVLLAARLPDVRRIVTLAGNLDPDAWADLHHYTRLSASLNPARAGPLPGTIEQQHFAGGRDRVMPPGLVEPAAARLGARAVVVLPDVSHTSGWEKEWPAILAGHRVQAPAGNYWKE